MSPYVWIEALLISMRTDEALALLGLSWRERDDKDAIRAAWKRKIRGAHPDRNASVHATRNAQILNEAKDVLLKMFEDVVDKKQREHEEERRAREQREHEEERRAREKEQAEAILRKAQFKNDETTRGTRGRVHRKLENYPEGRALIEEMKMFFKNNFVLRSYDDFSDRLLVSDIMELFIQSRDQTSEVQRRLFQRHAKKMFQTIWPNAKYFQYSGKRCFLFMGIKK